MTRLNSIISFIFTKAFYHKAIAYGILILFLYLFQWVALIILLTFIFAYLFYSSSKFIKSKIDLFVCTKLKHSKSKDLFIKYFNLNIVIVIQYVVFIVILIWIISNAIPKIQIELTWLAQDIPILNEQIESIKIVLANINQNYTDIDSSVKYAFSSEDINYEVIFSIFEQLKNAGSIVFQFLFALILSFVFLLDRKKLKKYLSWIKKSNFLFLHYEYKIIFDKIIRSFWLILKAQASIAFINMLITTIWFYLIGLMYGGFPYILTMAIIIFIFSFIPILWMWLSAIPLVIIAYTIWWVEAAVLVFIMIITTTVFEAYYLNPKIVSNFFELPMSLTFIILFIWGHFFGIVWLLIWISLYYFVAELLKDIDKAISNKKKIKQLEDQVIKRVEKSV